MMYTLLGAHLLEQILHAVLVQRQKDRQCSCGVMHAEVFDFEPVLGIEDEWKAAQSRVQDLRKQMNDWANIIRDAEEALEVVSNVHRPILNAIKQKLKEAGQELYPNLNRQKGVKYRTHYGGTLIASRGLTKGSTSDPPRPLTTVKLTGV